MMVIMVNNHWLVVWNINEWRIFQSAMFVYQRVSFIYLYIYLIKLVVWNMIFFHSVGNVIIPTDELICFRGVGSTTNQFRLKHSYWKWWFSSWIYPLKMVIFHSFLYVCQAGYFPIETAIWSSTSGDFRWRVGQGGGRRCRLRANQVRTRSATCSPLRRIFRATKGKVEKVFDRFYIFMGFTRI